MPITFLDLILLTVMLISALLAMIRGFMREVLSIAAWVIAAGTTLYAFPRLLPMAKTYFNNDLVANAAVVGGTFLGTLLIVSILTVRISDMILDSRVGALDRTLGFLFGLARGLIIVAVAFIFFDWLVPSASQPNWVLSAKSRVILKGTGDWLQALLPEDMDKYLSQVLKKRKGGEEQQDAPDAPPPDRRSDLGTTTTTGSIRRTEPSGYERSDRDGMKQLIETRANQR
jgi:membrane protein required for colicin V production